MQAVRDDKQSLTMVGQGGRLFIRASETKVNCCSVGAANRAKVAH